MLFKNRRHAGEQLAVRLRTLRGLDVVILALPRGGVPVAFEVAEALDAPLDLLFVRKIGVPGSEELAAGALAGASMHGAFPEIFLNEEIVREFGITRAILDPEVQRLRGEIESRRASYLRGRSPVELAGRTVIVVDDGVATGATVRVALQALVRSGAARRVLAIPVAPPDVAEVLRSGCDDAVFLATPAHFGAVGRFYEDFRPTSDSEVMALLDQNQRSHPGR